ncbi:MAG: winged helix-turn-helix domain-containing protein [Pseudomonadota bacterium]
MQITFGDTRFDSDLGHLTREGVTETLTPQTHRLIDYLVRNRNRVVEKDDLVAHVWNGRFVTDATLSTAIKEVRAALGDSGREQKVIRTVHGRGFRFVAQIADAPAREDMPVIALLPFRALEESRDAQLLAEGLTQETIAALSAFSDLRVLSLRTTAHFASAAIPPEELHKSHQVDILVEGSVREAQGETRVTILVTDAASGRTIGSEKLARRTDAVGLIEIEEELGRLIAGRVGSKHGAVAEQLLASRRAERVEKVDAYLLLAEFDAWYRSYDTSRHAELRETFARVLERDTSVSCLWSAYAILLLEEYRYRMNARPGVDALALASKAAQRAVACGRRGGFAHAALAMTRFYRHDIAGFRDAAERALELNPTNSDILAEIGSCHAMLGEEDRAIALLDRAMELSPVHPGWYHYARCWRYAREGYLEAALVEIDKVPMPGFFWYHAHLAWFLAELGRTDEAAEQAEIMLELYPDFETSVRSEQAMNNHNGALGEMSIAGWRKAGLKIPDVL